jgi:hypothetical protein
LQVTNAESHFTLPIASDVSAGACSTAPTAERPLRTPSGPRETREPPRFWRLRAASAPPFRAPCPTNLPSRRKKAEAPSDAPLSLLERFAPDGSSAIIAHNSRVATSLGSRDSLAASSHGSTFRRANADMTLSAIPFSSSPIGAKRNSSNLCSKRNSEWIFGISITASRRLSGQRGEPGARLRLPRLRTYSRAKRGVRLEKYSIWLGGVRVSE